MDTLIAAMDESFFYTTALQLVGARRKVGIVDVLADQKFIPIDLDEALVPSNARIVAVNLTPHTLGRDCCTSVRSS